MSQAPAQSSAATRSSYPTIILDEADLLVVKAYQDQAVHYEHKFQNTETLTRLRVIQHIYNLQFNHYNIKETITMASPIKVLNAPHTGITVRSLERAIHLFRDILNLPVQRTARLSPPISTITGRSEVEIDIAIIELPGGHCVELLEHSLPVEETQVEMKPMSWEVGSWHLCLTVQSLDQTVKALAEYDSNWTSMAAPQLLEKGPNAGRRLVYVRNKEDGLILEFFE